MALSRSTILSRHNYCSINRHGDDFMNKGFLFGFVVSALISNPSFAQEQSQTQAQQAQVGRYQVVDATLSNPPDVSQKQFKRLVILDTATGALTVCDYVYQDAEKAKDNREYWWANGYCAPFVARQALLVPKSPKK